MRDFGSSSDCLSRSSHYTSKYTTKRETESTNCCLFVRPSLPLAALVPANRHHAKQLVERRCKVSRLAARSTGSREILWQPSCCPFVHSFVRSFVRSLSSTWPEQQLRRRREFLLLLYLAPIRRRSELNSIYLQRCARSGQQQLVALWWWLRAAAEATKVNYSKEARARRTASQRSQ